MYEAADAGWNRRMQRDGALGRRFAQIPSDGAPNDFVPHIIGIEAPGVGESIWAVDHNDAQRLTRRLDEAHAPIARAAADRCTRRVFGNSLCRRCERAIENPDRHPLFVPLRNTAMM